LYDGELDFHCMSHRHFDTDNNLRKSYN
jgi:hypothetical protein